MVRFTQGITRIDSATGQRELIAAVADDRLATALIGDLWDAFAEAYHDKYNPDEAWETFLTIYDVVHLDEQGNPLRSASFVLT